jgi:proteasome accessory factor B
MTDRIDRTERLLNLVICLMATSHAVSRAQIQRDIPGYAESASETAFERMFERDKDELRSMGIPVETVSDTSGEVLGYRIPQDSYAMASVDLTIAERAAVAVASQVWGQAIAAPVAGTALRKLESTERGSDMWAPAGLRGSVQLTTSDAALLPLMAAIRQDRVVTFPYRTPTQSEATVRTVSPWGLRSAAGHWFLVAHDEDREATRTFRLSRFAGPVTVTARERAHRPPADFDISAPPGIDAADDVTVRARVRVAPGRAASLRRRAEVPDEVDRWTVEELSVPGSSVEELTALACAAGPDAVVLEPPELVAAVSAALERIRSIHAGAAS